MVSLTATSLKEKRNANANERTNSRCFILVFFVFCANKMCFLFKDRKRFFNPYDPS
jgi:hypothetical protein